MNPREIQNILYNKGWSVTKVAEMCGVSATAVSQTIHGRMVSDKIRSAIARAVRMPVNEIWPGHLLEDGLPKRRGRPSKSASL